MSKQKIRVRKTLNCRHPYTAHLKGIGSYGWGDTPVEAKNCLIRQLTDADRAAYAPDYKPNV